jgi:hypothetical protein
MPEDAEGGADIEPLGHGGENLPDALGRSLGPIEGGSVAGGHGVAAGLAAEPLDVVRATAAPIRHQGVDRGVDDTVGGAGRLAAGVALGRDALGCFAPAPPLAPRRHHRRSAVLARVGREPTAQAILGAAWPQPPDPSAATGPSPPRSARWR